MTRCVCVCVRVWVCSTHMSIKNHHHQQHMHTNTRTSACSQSQRCASWLVSHSRHTHMQITRAPSIPWGGGTECPRPPSLPPCNAPPPNKPLALAWRPCLRAPAGSQSVRVCAVSHTLRPRAQRAMCANHDEEGTCVHGLATVAPLPPSACRRGMACGMACGVCGCAALAHAHIYKARQDACAGQPLARARESAYSEVTAPTPPTVRFAADTGAQGEGRLHALLAGGATNVSHHATQTQKCTPHHAPKMHRQDTGRITCCYLCWTTHRSYNCCSLRGSKRAASGQTANKGA